MAVLVTGATGFLGRHLLQSLHAEGSYDNIVVLVRDRTEWEAYEWTRAFDRVTLLEGSVTAPQLWQDAPCLRNLQGIFHLAALVRHSRRNAAEVYQVNIEGTQGMVRLAARYGCRMVFVSTSGTVGCFRDARSRADEAAPYCEREVKGWPYYNSKIKAEKSARALASQLGVTLVIVRPPILLGPGDHRFRSTGNVIRFLRRRLPFLIRGGIHFVDIRDASLALVRAMRHPEPQQVYHLAGTACSIERFFGTLEEISGVPKPKMHLPFPLAWSLARAGEWIGMRLRGEPLSLLPDPVVVEMAARYWDVSSLHAAHDLGFVSRDGRETLQDTVTWLQENHQALQKAPFAEG